MMSSDPPSLADARLRGLPADFPEAITISQYVSVYVTLNPGLPFPRGDYADGRADVSDPSALFESELPGFVVTSSRVLPISSLKLSTPNTLQMILYSIARSPTIDVSALSCKANCIGSFVTWCTLILDRITRRIAASTTAKMPLFIQIRSKTT